MSSSVRTMSNDADETQAPIETVRSGDIAITTSHTGDHAWRVSKVRCEGDSRSGSVYALYKFTDDPTPAIREREGTLIRVIRRPL